MGAAVTKSSTAEVLSSNIVTLLPEDGTPVANRIMRAMLAKRIGANIDPSDYFNSIGVLTDQGIIGRSRGRGGSIFLSSPAPTPSPAPMHVGDKEHWSEAQLMYSTKVYLEQVFAPSLDLPAGSMWIVSDTSNTGPRDGEWARPDFVLVTVMHFQYLPGSQLDVHSFELKNELGGSVQAVHEALAQTRFTNFGHLIWHIPIGSRTEAKLPEIEAHCKEHGMGLIVIRDPRDVHTWETLLDPEQKTTNSATVDAFLHSRLPPVYREKIRFAVKGERQ